MIDHFNTLSRDQVRAALKFEAPTRPPLAMSLWHNQETVKGKEDEWAEIISKYPDDCIFGGIGCNYWNAPEDDPDYRWAFGEKEKPKDIHDFMYPVIAHWKELDQFIQELPNPNRKSIRDGIINLRKKNPDKYILIGFGHYLHQRLAYIRGLENLLLDFYDHPIELKKIMTGLLERYEIWAKMLKENDADGAWAGDDLGTQLSLFMSREIFLDLYKPFYCELANIFHSNGLDFWFHSCGNITKLLPDLLDIGIDALHPIQAGTMDDEKIAKEFGGKIAFWIGMDVQQIIPFSTPEKVRQHVISRIKTFYRPDGGLVLAAGNAILQDTPLENIRVYAEALRQPVF